MKFNKLQVILVAICVSTFTLKASDSYVTRQLWLDFNPYYKLSGNTTVFGDVGFRTLSPYSWQRYILRPSVRWAPDKFKEKKINPAFTGGLGFFMSNKFDSSNLLEVRPFQGFRFDWPRRKHINLMHYARLEERFYFGLGNGSYDFGMRFRYMFNLKFSLPGNPLADKDGLYFPFTVEPFFNINRTVLFNDHLRVIPGVGYYFSKKWRTEFVTAFHLTGYSDDHEGDLTTQDFVARFRVFYYIN